MLATEVTPSPTARRLFNRMVNRSDEHGCLSINASFLLGVELGREGGDPQATTEITELVKEHWIVPQREGGWLLD